MESVANQSSEKLRAEIAAFSKLNADHQLMHMMEVFLGRKDSEDLAQLVVVYKETVRDSEFTLESRYITKRLQHCFGDRPKETVRILDHGSGGWGATVFILLALGYKQVYGLHIGDVSPANQFARRYFNTQHDPLMQYDGGKAPFEDRAVDFIFSEQVLEHVDPSMIDLYYSEEARILDSGGVCYHIAPHRLRPYDSHTGAWLIHYLPRRLWLWILDCRGLERQHFEKSLFLRSRRFHLSRLRRYFDGFEDVTLERVLDYDRKQFFDGPQKLRNALDTILRNRFTGIITRPVARLLFSFSTIAFRK